MSIIGVLQAQFAFSAGSPQELSVAEGDLLYLFEKGDDGWWTCKKRIPGAANDEPTGLVPHNFVAPASPTGDATALYSYTAQTTEELSFSERQVFQVYAQDGDWVLVGGNDTYGFAPANYLEMAGAAPPLPVKDAKSFAPPPKHHAAATATASAGGSASASRSNSRPETPNAAQIPLRSDPTTSVDDEAPPPMPRRPGDSSKAKSSSEKSSSKPAKRVFEVYNVDKRRTVDLVIDTSYLIVGEDEWKYPDIISYSTEKKHLFVELQNPRASLDLRTETRERAEAILAEIAGMTGAHRGGGGLQEVFVAAKSAGNKSARVSMDFVAANGRELSVKEGETVFVLDGGDKEWWLVRSNAGVEGMLPRHLLEVEEKRSLWPFKRGDKSQKENAKLDRQRSTKSTKSRSGRDREREREREREYEREEEHERRVERRDSRRSSRHERGHERIPSDRTGSRKLPDQRKVRTWTDRSGSFRVDAAFLGCADGKIHLHKQNGVKIAVPANKLSPADLEYVESITGVSFSESKPLVDKIKSPSSSSAAPAASSSAPTEGYDWFEFFLACGIDPQNCQRYAINFTRDRMDEDSLPGLNPQVLRTLGLKEGDILRVTKKVREQFEGDAWVNKEVSPAPAAEPKPQAVQPQLTQTQPTQTPPVASQPTGALADLLGMTSIADTQQANQQAAQQAQQAQKAQLQAQAEAQQRELAARQRALREAQDKLAEQKHEAERKMLEAQRTSQTKQQREILEQQANLQRQQIELLKQQQEHLRNQQADFIQIQKTGQSMKALGPFATGIAQQSTFQPVMNSFGAQTTGFGAQSTGFANAGFVSQTTGGFAPVTNQPTGPFSQTTGFQSQPTGPFQSQPTGPFAVQSQPTPFQPTGPFAQQPQQTPFQSQPTGPFAVQSQPTGPFAVQSQPTGPFAQPLQSNRTGPFAQPVQNQPTGPFSQPLQSNRTGPFAQPVQNHVTGPFGQPFGAQATGPFGAQPFGGQATGAFQAQPSQQAQQPFGSQATGPFGQQPAQPFGSQTTGPFGQVPPFGSQATGPFQAQQPQQPFSNQATGPFAQPSAPQPAINQQRADPFGDIFRQATGKQVQPTLQQTGQWPAQQPFGAQPFQPQQSQQPQKTGFQPQSQFGQQQMAALQSQPTGFGFGNQQQRSFF